MAAALGLIALPGTAVAVAPLPGDLDPSFSGDGRLLTAVGEFDRAFAAGSAIQSDGRVVVVGSSGSDFAVARFTTAGELDTSFSGDGLEVTEFGGSGTGQAEHVAIQPDGKIVVVGTTNQNFAIARYTPSGVLDTSFSLDGRQTTDFVGGSADAASAVAIQANGAIVVAGSSNNDFAVARYSANGTLDPSFSADGRVIADFGVGQDVGSSLAIQPDGGIVVAGHANSTTSSPFDFALARFTVDGVLDTGFSADGRVTTDLGSDDTIEAMAIQSDAMIVVTGESNGDFALARYTTSGALDTGFSSDGLVRTDFGGADAAGGVAIGSDGRIVAAGATLNPLTLSGDFALSSYDTAGNLDPSFDGDGRLTTSFGDGQSDVAAATDLLVQADGKILASGFSGYLPAGGDFALARYSANGAPDPGFGVGGRVEQGFATIGESLDTASAVAIQPDGKLVVAGSAIGEDGHDDLDFAIARYTRGGALDTSSGGDGTGAIDIAGNSPDSATDIAIQPDGRIVVVGQSGGDFAVARFTPEGSFDSSFGVDGVVQTGFAAGSVEIAAAVAIQPDGRIVFAGASNGNFAVARYTTSGALDAGFSGDGLLTTDFGSVDIGADVAIQANGRIVVAGRTSGNFAVARYTAAGLPDTSFDGDGRLVTDFGGNDAATSISIQANDRLVVAGVANADFALARYGTNGVLDSSFSGDGKATVDFGGGADIANDVGLQSNGAIVVVGTAHDNDFAIARLSAAGVLDTSFSGDGLLTTDFNGTDKGAALVVQPDDNLVVAGSSSITFGGSNLSRFAVARVFGNGPPEAVNDIKTVNEDSGSTTINVLANDTDIDQGSKSVDFTSQPAHGTVVVTGGGSGLSYRPDDDYCNTHPGGSPDTFTYTLTPGGSTATVSVTVECVEDDPVAVDDARTVDEDSAATPLTVLANDTDTDLVPQMTIASATKPAHGTVVLSGGSPGSHTGLSYEPDPNYCNSLGRRQPRHLQLRLAPGGSTATVSVTVTCFENDDPVAVNDTKTVDEDSGATAINVLANDTDPDVTPVISIASATDPARGTVALTGGGTGLTYEPDPNYCNSQPAGNPDTFTYTLAPGGSTATVSVTVSCLNDDDPVAVNDTKTVNEDSGATAINVLANDTDTDLVAQMTIASATKPDNGTVVVNGAGTSLTYRPDDDYCNEPGPEPVDTFTYSLSPGGSTATVSVTVNCIDDDDPVAVDDARTVDEDSAATPLTVLANDTDTDLVPQMTIASATKPAHGTVVLSGGSPGSHTGLSYEPDPNYCNEPAPAPVDTFSYRLAPGGSTATVSVTVTCFENDDPVAVNDTKTVDEDSGATAINVLANDTDPDVTPVISIASATDPARGTVALTGGGTGLTYEPDPNYCNSQPAGNPDTFTYTLAPGGSTATVSVTVSCLNDDDPVAVNDTKTVNEDSGATAINVLANDTDTDLVAQMTIASATKPDNGTVVVNGAGTSLTYRPDDDYCNEPGPEPVDTFTYSLSPGGSTATVSVTVNCIDDDDPVAVDDARTVDEDSAATPLTVLANDTDTDLVPQMTIASATKPAHGTVVLSGGSPGSHTGLSYEPDPNYCNEPAPAPVDTFSYSLAPGGSTATVSVTVTCFENDDPVAVNDTKTVDEDSGATAINVLANDTDPDVTPVISIASATDPARGTVVLTGGSPGAHTGLTYEPDPNYCNSQPAGNPDTFTYTLAPGGSTATVSVTVSCLNDDDPVAVNDTKTVNEDSGATAINVLANDTDTDLVAQMTIASATKPDNGTVVVNGAGTSLTYRPDDDYCNEPGPEPVDTFTYSLSPGGSTATVSVTVNCIDDDDPVAVDDARTVDEDSAATPLTVLANDTDTDLVPQMTIASATKPAHGTVVLSGGSPGSHTGLSYEPDPNYCNEPAPAPVDTFSYSLAPGGSTATVSVTVTCFENDDPVAVNDTKTVDEDSGATAINVLANDTDPDVTPVISIASATDPARGTVVLTGGSPGAHTGLTYEPDPNYCNSQPAGNPDTFTYSARPRRLDRDRLRDRHLYRR